MSNNNNRELSSKSHFTSQMAHLSLGVCEYGSAAIYFSLGANNKMHVFDRTVLCVPEDEVKSIRSVRFKKLQPLFVPHNIILELLFCGFEVNFDLMCGMMYKVLIQ